MDFDAATMKELVEYYNTHSGEEAKVARFASLAVGRKRCAALTPVPEDTSHYAASPNDQWLIDSYGTTHCPHCDVHLDNGVSNHGDEVNGRRTKHDHSLHVCLACNGEFGPALEPAHETRPSPGIAASWHDEAVREARRQRSACTVDGKRYGSVRKAYIALGIDLKDHISFRMMLKEQGTIKIDGRVWKNIPLNY